MKKLLFIIIVISLGLIIINSSNCYNVEGLNCDISALKLGRPGFNAYDTNSYYSTMTDLNPHQHFGGTYKNKQGEAVVTEIPRYGGNIDRARVAALDCLNRIGISNISNELTDQGMSERTITITTDHTGDYKFKDDSDVTYDLSVDENFFLPYHTVSYFAEGVGKKANERTLPDGTIPNITESWKLWGQIMEVDGPE